MPNLASVPALVLPEFTRLAHNLNLTPEFLASTILHDWTLSARSDPATIQILSAAPLGQQPCASCPIEGQCVSRARRERDSLICFDKLSVSVPQSAVPQ